MSGTDATTNNNTSASSVASESESPVKGAEVTIPSGCSNNVCDSDFRQNIRQWFITLSPDDRAAALSFQDESWMTLWTQLVLCSSPPTAKTTASSLSSASTSTPSSLVSPEIVTTTTSPVSEEGRIDSPKMTTVRPGLSYFDWQTMVRVRDVEEKLRQIFSLKSGGSDAPVGNNLQSNNYPSDGLANEKPKEIIEMGESDAFRIRDGAVKGDGVDSSSSMASASNSQSTASGTPCKTLDESMDSKIDEASVEESAKDVSQSPKKSSSQNDDSEVLSSTPTSKTSFIVASATTESRINHLLNKKVANQTVAKIMDSICSIFPAALTINTSFSDTSNNTTKMGATAQVSRESHTSFVPFITLHPDYVASISGEDLLSVLDCAMKLAYSMISPDDQYPDLHEFISPELQNNLSFENNLMSFVSKLSPATRGSLQTQDSHSSIPLFVLLLWRFQSSLMKTYRTTSGQTSNMISETNSATDSYDIVSSFLKALRKIEEKDSILQIVSVPRMCSLSPDLANESQGDEENLPQHPLLLSFDRVTNNLVRGSNVDKILKILNTMNADVAASITLDQSIMTEGRIANDPLDLEAIVASLEGSGDGSGVAGIVANGSGGRKTKKKKKKKKKRTSNKGESTVGGEKQEKQEKGDFPPQTDQSQTGEGVVKIPPSVDGYKPKATVEGNAVEQITTMKVLAETKNNSKTSDLPQTVDEEKPAKPYESEESLTTKIPMDKKPTQESFPSIADEQQKADYIQHVSRSIDSVHENKAQELGGKKMVQKPGTEEESAPAENDDDQWETVGARPRDRRKKGALAGSKSVSQQSGTNTASFSGQQGGNKKKSAIRKEKRNRSKNRKVANEILSSVLERVEEEIRHRSMSRDEALDGESALKRQLTSKVKQLHASPKAHVKTSSHRERETSAHGTKLFQSRQSGEGMTYSEKAKAANQDSIIRGKSPNMSKDQKSNEKRIPSKVSGPPADQNTIPTIPETLSTAPHEPISHCNDSSSGDSLEAQKSRNPTADAVKDSSPSPPLPTLLSPGNNNSSSSSVASSLDAPHGSLPDPAENEVGYHILGVCKRLTDEIALFMKRRADALSVRRQERRLVLSALEETLGSIWPGMCSVEMYGSCATNLDLPSSDLDVVVCGIDRSLDLLRSPSNATSSGVSTGESSATNDDRTQGEDVLAGVTSQQDMTQYGPDHHQYAQIPLHHNIQMMYPPISPNAERVMRLAVELEHQPWAVHVKAIPKATVPVIKILADPARLVDGNSSNGDWLLQHTAPSHGVSEQSDSHSKNRPPMGHFPSGQTPPLWRGADVVNGLLKVDITFEGPEHGGIGSTKYASKAVKEFSARTGLAPESTPAVQVLMVLKELLAQRRLNEPFSGGLSSYALLLLVISVIRERSIIRQELEKAERQRRVVAAGGGNSALRTPDKKKTKDSQSKFENTALKRNSGIVITAERNRGNLATETARFSKDGTNDGNGQISTDGIKKTIVSTDDAKYVPERSQSSWASIARQTSSFSSLQRNQSQHKSTDKSTDKSKESQNVSSSRRDLKKPSSFADAVSKSVSKHDPRRNPPRHDSKEDILEKKEVEMSTKKQNIEDHAVGALERSSNEDMYGEKGKAFASVSQRSAEAAAEGTTPPNRISDNNGPDSLVFPQGLHDVVEVLCSGETTPGKLLMHFLLFYGQHFDAQSTAIDLSRTHHRDPVGNQGYSQHSPYMQRMSAGNYDPVTGMLTVDPIVVYDPLIGAETNNVARSCFAWSNIRWLFAQSYMTLSSTVETNARQGKGNRSSQTAGEGPFYGHDQSGNVVVDPNSPLLELLLSY